LRASFNEIEEAEEEGVQIIRNRAFKRILLEKGKITGVECLEAEVGDVVDGKRQFKELPGTEHVIPGDLIIWAIGQRPDFSFLPGEEQLIQHSTGGIHADARMMTNLEGVFTAGDVRRGTTFFVVDAVGEGHQAARSIVDYLQGNPTLLAESQQLGVDLEEQEVKKRWAERREAQVERTAIQRIPASDRENSFIEVELTIGEKEAKREAKRCLSCGPCSECLACLEVCEPGAIFHDQSEIVTPVEIRGWITSDDEVLGRHTDCLVPIQGDHPLAGAAAGFEVLKAHPDLLIPDPTPRATFPAQRDGTGVMICRCGGEISRYLDTTGLCKEIRTWPDISQAVEIQSACSSQGADQIKALLQENQLGQWILAACSCCSLDQVCYSCTYQRIRCKGNLDVYSELQIKRDIKFVNIREGCAFLHPRSRKRATQAALGIIAGALGTFPNPPHQLDNDTDFRPITLVVGKGKSAQVCQSALAEIGYHTEPVEVLSGPIIRVGGKFITPGPDKELQADCLVLAPTSGAELDYISTAVQLTQHRPLLENTQFDDARRLGIFTCLPALDPNLSGRGAAGEVLAWAGIMRRHRQQPAAWVNPLFCRSCGTCVEVCGLGIPKLESKDSENPAWINPSLCQDCGTCVARCPSGAIQPGGQTDLMLVKTLKRVMS
jgi:ferredoxin